MVASYAKKRQGATLHDIGFVQQVKLYHEVAAWSGTPPLVIDSDDIRADPEAMLRKLCTALGLSFTRSMLRWPAGGNVHDGTWAPHWYGAIHRSTGFEEVEGPLPVLGGAYADLVAQALPHYDRLAQVRM